MRELYCLVCIRLQRRAWCSAAKFAVLLAWLCDVTVHLVGALLVTSVCMSVAFVDLVEIPMPGCVKKCILMSHFMV